MTVKALSLTILLATTSSCKDDPPIDVPRKGDEGGGDSYCPPPCSPDGTPPGPWATLSWDIQEVHVDNPTRAAADQGRLVRASDGTLYYAYLKFYERVSNCDIAVFGGGTAPGVNYELWAAKRDPGADTWTRELVPLDTVGPPNYVTSRYGIDSIVDNNNRLVIAVAAGGAGLASCGSTDMVLATWNGPSSWNVRAIAVGSDAFSTARPGTCQAGECLECCEAMQNACGTGTDVGAWATIAIAPNNTVGVAFTDYHNFWDEDGQNYQGLEFWEGTSTGGGTMSGIRAWSGMGLYAGLVYTSDNIPVVAFTGYKRDGLQVLRRPDTSTQCDNWKVPGTVDTPDRAIQAWERFKIGERIRMARAPDGTIGMVFHAVKDGNGTPINDLVYCFSTDGGVNWGFPCKRLGLSDHVGYYPSLAYDADSIPYVSYQFCGPASDCQSEHDGARMAWWDAAEGKWWRFIIHGDTASRSGFHSGIVIDPTTKEPTVVFQHLTRGSAVVAQGRFN
ncbi:hypothetical protein ACFL6C_12830 [Myxococcota bacterium]